MQVVQEVVLDLQLGLEPRSEPAVIPFRALASQLLGLPSFVAQHSVVQPHLVQVVE